eukprot:TRINITY_DN16395_c0_g1_i1.p1 TRINITY_DN16395_c0_g1~~TRINITY_DN16395_c0_g1_i1.p1  ORF type:complete len:266 (+),score=73.13 TRINITY_DN16395_c0_g1_i1:49-798(+)
MDSSTVSEDRLSQVWDVLWGLLAQYVDRPRQRWVHSKVIERMSDALSTGQLEDLDFHHPWLSMQDRGLMFLARWLRDYRQLFEGTVRRLGIAGHDGGREGLRAIAQELPQSVMEVDVRGNTACRRGRPEWIDGIVDLVLALRRRGGGYVHCGRAHADEAEALARKLQHASFGAGAGDVVVVVNLYGETSRQIEVSALASSSRLDYAEPDWGAALLGPTDEAPYNHKLQPHDAFAFDLPTERVVFGNQWR